MEHYFKVLHERGYEYADHYAPHDIENRILGASGAKSLKELAADGYSIDGQVYKVDFHTVPRTTNVNSDIEKVRQILTKCAFDAIKSEQGLKALESYRKDWNEKLGVWRDKPLHDWASHGADAFRYFAVSESQDDIPTSLTVRFQ